MGQHLGCNLDHLRRSTSWYRGCTSAIKLPRSPSNLSSKLILFAKAYPTCQLFVRCPYSDMAMSWHHTNCRYYYCYSCYYYIYYHQALLILLSLLLLYLCLVAGGDFLLGQLERLWDAPKRLVPLFVLQNVSPGTWVNRKQKRKLHFAGKNLHKYRQTN